MHVWQIAVLLFVSTGIWMLLEGTRAGYVLVALGLILVMQIMWYVLDLRYLKLPKSAAHEASTYALENILTADVILPCAKAKNPKQLWRLLNKYWQNRFITVRLGISSVSIEDSLSERASDLELVWKTALETAKQAGQSVIDIGTLSVSLIRTLPNLDSYLAQIKLSQEDVRSVLMWQQRLERMMQRIQQKPFMGGFARDWAFGYTPLLNKYGQNLTRELEKGSFPHLNQQVHNELLAELTESLAAREGANIAITGEVGTGKTNLVYSLAEKLLTDEAPERIIYNQVVALNPSVLISSAPDRGQLEYLVTAILSEAIRAKNIIIFLDDAQLFFSDKTGSVDLSNILLPVLEGGNLRLILAMSSGDWQRTSTTNNALAALFTRLSVPEPDSKTILGVMQDQAITLEAQTKTTFTHHAVVRAQEMADRYVFEQAFPGSGVALLASAARFANGGLITADSVDKTVQSTLGVKVAEASAPERAQLLELEDRLHRSMVNQEQAVKAVSDALRRSRAGVADSKRPIGSFLFLGPTGVGKTQLAKTLAAEYFSDSQNMIRVDMSEYASPRDIHRLLASPKESSAGLLAQMRTRPSSLVLLDEVEKAHPDILNLLLAMLEEGELTDTEGHTVSFSDSIVIATSNAGADEIRRRIEVGENLSQFSKQFIDNLIDNRKFLPELINRFDEIVLFRPLNQSELAQIVELMLSEINKTMSRQKIKVTLTPAVINWLVARGNDPRLGARPLRRVIARSVENVVARKVLSGQVTPGSTVELDVQDLESP